MERQSIGSTSLWLQMFYALLDATTTNYLRLYDVRCCPAPERAGRGSDMMRAASCHCGQLSLSVEGEPASVSACNCSRCQRRSGSAFALTSRWSKNQVTRRSGDSVTYVRKGASGGKVECVFCPQCGSTVSTALELLPDLIGIPVGCFADPTFPGPKVALGATQSSVGFSSLKERSCCATKVGPWKPKAGHVHD